MPKRRLGKDRPVDLETDELEQPIYDEENVTDLASGEEVDPGRPAGMITESVTGQAEETIAFSGDHMYSLDAATDTEFPTLSEGSEVVMDEIDKYTDDEDVLQDFAERQQLNNGREELVERLEEHNSKSPDLSGGDIDARWEDADVSGEESVGSTVPTPDQDVVDELGDAFGIDYEFNEPLATADKLDNRDRNRFELSPASMEQDPDEEENDRLVDLEDDLDADLDDNLSNDDEEELEENLDDEYADEIEAELDLELEDEEAEEDEFEDDDEDDYDIEDLDDELDDLDDFLDDDLDDDED